MCLNVLSHSLTISTRVFISPGAPPQSGPEPARGNVIVKIKPFHSRYPHIWDNNDVGSQVYPLQHCWPCSTKINVMQLLTFSPAPPLTIIQLLLILAQLGQTAMLQIVFSLFRWVSFKTWLREKITKDGFWRMSEAVNDKFVSITLITINISLYSPSHKAGRCDQINPFYYCDTGAECLKWQLGMGRLPGRGSGLCSRWLWCYILGTWLSVAAYWMVSVAPGPGDGITLHSTSAPYKQPAAAAFFARSHPGQLLDLWDQK